MTKQTRQDIYQQITDRIVFALESGVRPWMQPWAAGHDAGPVCRPLRHDGTPYRGINVLVLWSAAAERGYECPLWLTFNQAKQYGGCVRKGEHGERVVYASTYTKTEQNEAGEDEERQVGMLKAYTVFNAEQCDGLPERFYQMTQAEALDPAERIEVAGAFFAATGATIKHGGGMACYSVTADEVRMPAFERFESAEAYYATLAHEMTHWTRHPSRLARDFGRKRWGDAGYATEELVAELGSAFLAADLGLELTPREDHAAYIESWLQVLKNDKRAIFTAASHASRAADYLHTLTNQQQAAA